MEFVWLLLNSPMSGFNAVNVAAADPVTIREVFVLIAEILGEIIEIIEDIAPKSSFTRSSERAERLGYKVLPIKQMLRRYFEDLPAGMDCRSQSTRQLTKPRTIGSRQRLKIRLPGQSSAQEISPLAR